MPTVPSRRDLVYGTYIPGMTSVAGYANGTVGLADPDADFVDVYPTDPTTGYIYLDTPASASAPRSNIRYWGKVKCRFTADTWFSNCVFANRRPEDMYAANVGANGGGIENYGANPPHLWLADCLFDPKAWYDAGLSDFWGHPVQVGIHGGNFTAERSEWRNCQDDVNYVGPNTSAAANAAYCQMYANQLHANFYLKPWTGPGSPASQDTHSDAFQWNTGKHIDLRWNLFGGYHDEDGYTATTGFNSGDDCHNSACMIQQEAGTADYQLVRDVNVSDNWMAGGAATINANLKNGNTGADWTFARNKIARRGTLEWAGAGYYIYRHGGLPTVFDSNVIWDYDGDMNGTGVAAPIVDYPGT